MFPTIDKRKTGINIRRIMDERGLTVKDVQEYLGLACIQSIYHWLNGITMPTVDNLYVLSELLQVPVDDMLCGNRKPIYAGENRAQLRRLYTYYARMGKAA